MTTAEQDKSMNVKQIQHNIAKARSTGLYPIDLWGGEWWYWRHLQGDNSIWRTIHSALLKR